MIALAGRMPVREHLRPKARRPVHTAADVAPRLLAACPSTLEELNLVSVSPPTGGEA